MRTHSGFLLLEAIVGFFLIFLSSMVMFRLLATSDRGYSQATQTRVALRLARQTLEGVRAGSIPKSIGTQTLSVVNAQLATSTMAFTPQIICTSQSTYLLVRSRITWSEGTRAHAVELKTYVEP